MFPSGDVAESCGECQSTPSTGACLCHGLFQVLILFLGLYVGIELSIAYKTIKCNIDIGAETLSTRRVLVLRPYTLEQVN